MACHSGPHVAENHEIPHLKGLISGCLEPKVQGHGSSFPLCQALKKIGVFFGNHTTVSFAPYCIPQGTLELQWWPVEILQQ